MLESYRLSKRAELLYNIGKIQSALGECALALTAYRDYLEQVPDGRYRATLAAANATDAIGRPLAQDVVIDFHVLAGDATRDGVVNLADFNILATNFGQSNRTFSQGDFDYNGQVNLADFNILAGKFNTALASRPAPTLRIASDPVPGASPVTLGLFGSSLLDGDRDWPEDHALPRG